MPIELCGEEFYLAYSEYLSRQMFREFDQVWSMFLMGGEL